MSEPIGDLEEKLSQVLGDPESMAQIFSVAQSLGLPIPSAEPEEAPCAAQEPQDDGLGMMLRIVRQAGRADPRESALLNALKPYCSAERQRRIDRALRIARISQLAGAALRSIDRKD